MPTHALVPLLETAVLLGDRESASLIRRCLDGLDTPYCADPDCSTCVARHLGAAAALLGEADNARAYYQRALEACEKIRFRPKIALTQLQLAELLLEHYPEERSEALEHLDFCIVEFGEMKMQPSLERALSRREILRA